MRLIGLCGRSGSGKGVFASVADEQGIKVIDCDAVYAELVSHSTPCLEELTDSFGGDIIKDGALDRKKMAKIVFSDGEKLKKLNEIAHRHIRAELEKIFALLPNDSVILLDAPTLFESGIDAICDLIVTVIAPDGKCIERITARDGLTYDEAVLRLNNQKTPEFLIENSDIVIYNDTTLDDFKKASSAIAKGLINGAI